jgi:PKD repeat protein
MKYFSLLLLCFVMIVSARGQNTTILQPGPSDGQDVYINSAFPDMNMYGGDNPGVLVTAWTFDGVFGIGRGLIRFDLSDIPVDATITSATLDLYFYPNCCIFHHYGDNGWYIRKVTGPWGEHTATWNNQPASSGDGQIELPPSTDSLQNYTGIDLTQFVREWVANPASNNGFICQIKTEEIYRSVTLGFSESPDPAARPRLSITWSGCTPATAAFTESVHFLHADFTDQTQGALSWNWSFGDGTTSSLQNPGHDYPDPGIYKVSLTTTDSCGASETTHYVETTCQQPVADFIHSNNYPDVYFYDTSFTANFVSRLWDFGDNSYSTEKYPVHQYPAPGIYYACLTVNDSCGSSTKCDTIYYDEPLMVHFTGNAASTNDRLVSFTDETAGATNWLWNFGDGATATVQNPVHLYADYGKYTVCLTAGNSIIHTTQCDALDVTAAKPASGIGRANLYPNPTGDYTYIGFPWNVAQARIRISDPAGRILYDREFTNVVPLIPVSLDLGSYAKGVYVVRAEYDGSTSTWKVVVQ